MTAYGNLDEYITGRDAASMNKMTYFVALSDQNHEHN
jgi:hypothetical protein